MPSTGLWALGKKHFGESQVGFGGPGQDFRNSKEDFGYPGKLLGFLDRILGARRSESSTQSFVPWSHSTIFDCSSQLHISHSPSSTSITDVHPPVCPARAGGKSLQPRDRHAKPPSPLPLPSQRLHPIYDRLNTPSYAIPAPSQSRYPHPRLVPAPSTPITPSPGPSRPPRPHPTSPTPRTPHAAIEPKPEVPPTPSLTANQSPTFARRTTEKTNGRRELERGTCGRASGRRPHTPSRPGVSPTCFSCPVSSVKVPVPSGAAMAAREGLRAPSTASGPAPCSKMAATASTA